MCNESKINVYSGITRLSDYCQKEYFINALSSSRLIDKQYYSPYLKMSPGWQSSASHIFSSVENLIALALPVFSIDRLAVVIPMVFARSLLLIFLLANMTSKSTIILI